MRFSLQTKILISMLFGIILGFICIHFRLQSFTNNWVKPFGTIFITLLKSIAVPLVFVSLLKGISSLNDISKLSRLSFRTISLYLSTTIIAISLGLVLGNVFKPGNTLSNEKKEILKTKFIDQATKKISDSKANDKKPPLQFFVDMFPENILKAFTENSKMLQVILFTMFLGIAIISIDRQKVLPFTNFIDSLNEILLKLIEIIMFFAPLGVFSLVSSLLVEFGGDSISEALDLFLALGYYSIVVLFGLFLMSYLVYPFILKLFTNFSILEFYKKMIPIQLVAFTTSSSSATLPVTMDNAEKNLNISKEVSSFVLPLGATINMDGTAIYQSISVLFIAQVFGYELDFSAQLNIILSATLASIGTAGVPGAGIVMLVIVLNSVGIPLEGIALIFAVERILDMFRTVVNVCGDIAVAIVVNEKEKKNIQN